ncbi:MAG: hypothetical protein ACOC1O_01425 [bacterium]
MNNIDKILLEMKKELTEESDLLPNQPYKDDLKLITLLKLQRLLDSKNYEKAIDDINRIRKSEGLNPLGKKEAVSNYLKKIIKEKKHLEDSNRKNEIKDKKKKEKKKDILNYQIYVPMGIEEKEEIKYNKEDYKYVVAKLGSSVVSDLKKELLKQEEVSWIYYKPFVINGEDLHLIYLVNHSGLFIKTLKVITNLNYETNGKNIRILDESGTPIKEIISKTNEAGFTFKVRKL